MELDNAFVISCHSTAPGVAKWLGGKDRPATCSVCKSLHPYEFVFQILNGGFIRGWLWEDGKPIFCETDGGLFYSAHLVDMSEEWLLANAYLIFKTTGLTFYWERDHIFWDAPFRGIRLGKGSAITLSAEQHQKAQQLISSKFYGRKIA